MTQKTTPTRKQGGRFRLKPEAANPLDRMVEGGARCYKRARDLPWLLPLWPHELADLTVKGTLRILSKLRRALRAERRRARAGHWSYELNRHLALLSAYKGEIALLRAAAPLSRREPVVAKQAFAVAQKDKAAKDVRKSPGQAR